MDRPQAGLGVIHPTIGSAYDEIAPFYDAWSRSVVEDVAFYVEEALEPGGPVVELGVGAACGADNEETRASPAAPSETGGRAAGPVVELGVGTGRIAIPLARAGIRVIGVDSSLEMLELCRKRARDEAVDARLDLRLGDLRRPPVAERVPLVICPFRSYLHLEDDGERLDALLAAREILEPGGRLVFDVFAPSDDDVAETHGRWLEREPGIFERADWDVTARTLTLSVRGEAGEATMSLAWASAEEWRALLGDAGFEVRALYGWFDRRPFAGGEDMVWIAEAAPDRPQRTSDGRRADQGAGQGRCASS